MFHAQNIFIFLKSNAFKFLILSQNLTHLVRNNKNHSISVVQDITTFKHEIIRITNTCQTCTQCGSEYHDIKLVVLYAVHPKHYNHVGGSEILIIFICLRWWWSSTS